MTETGAPKGSSRSSRAFRRRAVRGPPRSDRVQGRCRRGSGAVRPCQAAAWSRPTRRRRATMPQDTTILRQIFDPANRANPYPLWAQLRATPVCWQEDGPDERGTYVVSGYDEIAGLLHDPRVSSDFTNSLQTGGRATGALAHTFIELDPPEHDRLRRLAMRHFGPPERPHFLEELRPEIARVAASLLDRMQGQRRIDLVEGFAHPLPVAIICRILG